MLANEITPNAYTYIVIIKELASCSLRDPNFPHFVKFANMYFVEMLDNGLQPTSGTYIALSEKLDEGRDRKEFGELIKAKGQVDQANEFYKQNKRGIIPDVAIHTVVIEAYANAGKANSALKAYKHMLANGVDPNLYIYSVLIKALAADSDFILTARKYFLKMLDKSIIPNSDIYEAVSKRAKADDK
ncbi:hypothetical protein C1H46_043755 [Malus baccata]|uniref:Pentacotripeptide-repeat region of PRORP domain-containing protein n=1 Tax=Malus baccata TaxID=106549 RepID=A0A540K904_MALBA|nr:hypothetical protein C1H46_043755 [Malus baccata]